MTVAAAAPPPAPVPALEERRTAQSPATLEELQQRARIDLGSRPAPDTLLRWVFWHAKAVGRLEVARAVLKRYESEDWDARARASAYLPGTTQHETLMASRPEADLKRAQDYVTGQAAYVQACASVLAMLRAK